MLFRTIKQKFIGMSVGLLITLGIVFVVVHFLLSPVITEWEQYKTELNHRQGSLMSMQLALGSTNLSKYYALRAAGQDEQAKQQLGGLVSQVEKQLQAYAGTGGLADQERGRVESLQRLLGSGRGQNLLEAGEGDRYISDLARALQDLEAANQETLASSEKQIDQKFYNVSFNLAIFLLFALALGALVFTMVSRVITRPLVEMRRLMLQIAAENNLTIRIPIQRRDEIGETSAAINDMLDRFRILIRQVLGSSARLLNEVDQMNKVSLEAQSSMDVQHSETQMVAASMNEMSATVKTVSDNAEAAAQAANEAQGEANQGKQVVDRTVQSINALAREVERAAEVIHRLETDSESIGTVVDVIRGIAEQTNLLALNAAIEAARAGEQGRGFAVVADEVRTLASRTQESTREIQQTIERLQGAAVEAVGVMEDSKKEAESVVKQAARAGESLQSIIASVSTIADMNTQIASASAQQNATADEMNRNLAHISEMAFQTSEGAVKTVTACDKTVRQVEGLRMITAQFQVGEASLDLSAYKAGHLAWKPRLRSYLQGTYELTPRQVTDHTQCELGKWLYGEGKKKCGHYPEMAELDKVHADLHAQIKAVYDHKQSGKTKEAEAAYQRMSTDNDAVAALLDALEIRADREHH